MPDDPLRVRLPDRYQLVRHVADGGMASVWAARDQVLGRHVAIKVLAAGYAAEPAARRRFAREARAAARVSHHPHVVTIYDVGEHGEPPEAFIVMELLEGGTVRDRLRVARVDRATALRWLAEAASALDAAHAADIVHRDVKPGNLLLDGHDRLAVGDFGIASLADETQVTAAGQVLGTVAYLSPEQARGEAATAASDIYALAVVAHELLHGQRPGGSAPPVTGALARGLESDPARRPPTASALVEALRAEEDDAPTTILDRDDTTVPMASPRGPALWAPVGPRPSIAAAGGAAGIAAEASATRRAAAPGSGGAPARDDGAAAARGDDRAAARGDDRAAGRGGGGAPGAGGDRAAGRGGEEGAGRGGGAAALGGDGAAGRGGAAAGRVGDGAAGRGDGAAAGPGGGPAGGARRGRRWAPAAAVAALALVGGGTAAVVATNGGGSPAATTTDRAAASRTTTAREAAPATTHSAPAPAPAATATTQSAPAPAATTTTPDTGTEPAPADTGTTPAATTPAAGDARSPAALNDAGYALLPGDPVAAVPLLERAVTGYREQGMTDGLGYAFALYNLGWALRLAGRPAEAIPYLTERLSVSDNQRSAVRAELARARADAGS